MTFTASEVLRRTTESEQEFDDRFSKYLAYLHRVYLEHLAYRIMEQAFNGPPWQLLRIPGET